MSKGFGCLAAVVVVVVILAVIAGGSYNRLVGLSQAVDAQWAQVESVYQRRADLIPNLVATVQGAANFEKSTLEAVTKARASVGQAQPPNAASIPNDPAAFARFQAAQDQLSGALSRLLVVAEAYPDLKATQNFRDLQAQLEGTENRISVERMRYNETARDYNTARQRFPTGLFAGLLGFHEKGYFKAQPDAATAPKVNFDFSPAPPALPAGSPRALPPAPSARP
jgi:LemA protein